MNIYEILLWIAIVCAYFVLSYAIMKNYKNSLFVTALSCPAFYFVVYKSTQFWIIDTNKYLDRFIDLTRVSEIFPSCLITFSLSLMLVGTFNLLIRYFLGNRMDLSQIRAEKLAMMCHLLLGVIVTFLIVWVVWKYFVNENIKKRLKNRYIYLLGMCYVIFLLPIYILETKIFNYDSMSCLPGILALLLCIAGVKDKNGRLLVIAIVVGTLAAMEKEMASPILEMAVAIFAAFYAIPKKRLGDTILTVLKYTLFGYAMYIIIDIAVHIYTSVFLLNGERIIYNAETIFYALNGPISRVVKGAALDGGNQTGDTFAVFVIIVLAGVFLTYVVRLIRDKELLKKIGKVLPYYNVFVFIIIIVGGIYATYFVTLKVYPYTDFLPGEYRNVIQFDDWLYNYGGTTKWEQSLLLTLDSLGQVLNSISSVHLLLLAVFVIAVLLKKIQVNDENDFWIHCIIGGICTLILGYALVGIPPDAKYKSLFIIALIICVFLCIAKYLIISKKEVVLGIILIGLMGVEIWIYRPNELVFSPIWNIKSESEKKYPVTGEFRIGEAMSWGFHNMIAGEKIKTWAEQNSVPFEQIYIYSDYYSNWLENPGMNIRVIESSDDIQDFGEKDFYVLSRFALFREKIPEFIYQEKPLDTVEYRGEIVAWIYQGEQLKKYY